jgi:hypothetical protein
MCVCAYIYIYTHTHTHTYFFLIQISTLKPTQYNTALHRNSHNLRLQKRRFVLEMKFASIYIYSIVIVAFEHNGDVPLEN